MIAERMLMPDVQCPACRKRPRIRIPESQRDRAMPLPADDLFQTYQCHRCHTIYPVPVAAIQRAS